MLSDHIPARPAHHASFHHIRTPRLIIRSAIPSDAQDIYDLRSSPANHPHHPIEPNISPTVFAERIQRWSARTEEGKSAFMVIVLLPIASSSDDHLVLGLPQGVSHRSQPPPDPQGSKLIGFGGFNSFPFSPSLSDPKTEVLVGDIGVMIDHAYWRNGYGLEAVVATVDYAFDVLGCGMVYAGTDLQNAPWRAMMNDRLGLGGCEVREVAQDGPAAGQEGYAWRFDNKMWREARQG